MKLISEFKEFAVKGNMIDMAVGIIIGTAFNNVIQTLVKKVFLPPLSYLTDGVNFEDKKYVLREAVEGATGDRAKEIAISYGELINVSIDFIVIGFVVFVVVKLMNKLRNDAQDPKNKEVVTPKDIELLNDLKELMQEQNQLLKTK
ncbi:large conductance mechanosensitive channel [Nonlabens dokdonensis]|jgi:large conductance mechanosensitive channel|uniref:Large-conductance mechanosensitive channel n=2 Tax=Nonlabens dokdonensis TaxID=328515 RepID=L7WDD7_NONDD|nr:large conductance mechanosensitive channel protein MscL [Nonlabens dokdonensis]AGC78109.1 large conductance mechanosensitive channel [Nonlabens dokdonensis DSW-6]PZX37170.1 large conductance mechanosensitive channel [Nonlabens dokdonensis]